jgi:hypothetical protein
LKKEQYGTVSSKKTKTMFKFPYLENTVIFHYFE